MVLRCHSSKNHLPVFHLATPEKRGVLVGVGWSGQWLARMAVHDSELHAEVGMKETRLKLHPAEKIRAIRILLVFWEGERLHGHNMLRRTLYNHYLPRLDGQPQKPLVSVNTCFTYHGKGGYLYSGEKTFNTDRTLHRNRRRSLCADVRLCTVRTTIISEWGLPPHRALPTGPDPVSELCERLVYTSASVAVEPIDLALPFAKAHPNTSPITVGTGLSIETRTVERSRYPECVR